MSAPFIFILRIAMLIALYAFLGWALVMIWQDLKQRSLELAAFRPPLLTLNIESSESFTPIFFNTPEVTIGRNLGCDFTLEDATVSAKHARLFYQQGHWWLEDLHSTNGTFLNEQPVTTPVALTNRDRLRFGQVILCISVGESIIS